MTIRLLCGDALEQLRLLPDESVQCCITSPPYWGLRDYGVPGQLGLERTPEEYVGKLVEVFREVRRVLRGDGTLWLNLGDTYAGGGNYRGVNSMDTLTSKQASNRGARGLSQALGAAGKDFGLDAKQLVGIPWRVAFALQADGWWLRSDIIWSKPNPMPESVTDRPTKAHEYLFLLTKSARYYYDASAITEPMSNISGGWQKRHRQGINAHGNSEEAHGAPVGGYDNLLGRNRRSVWTIPTQPFPEAHFATFPEALIDLCIAAGTKARDIILDPFCGSGTTGVVALRAGCDFIGIDLSPEYVEMARRRIEGTAPLFAERVLRGEER